jgi:hypothetical protein
VQIDPSMTADQLRQAVVDYEKALFYKKTSFGELTGCEDLDFSAPGRYDVIYNHILVHKYYLNERAEGVIAFSDALVSWYNNVYKPIIDIIEEDRVYARFPDRTASDLYVWIVKHWDFLKRKFGVHFSMTDAARDFSTKYGEQKPLGRLVNFITSRIHRIFG